MEIGDTAFSSEGALVRGLQLRRGTTRRRDSAQESGGTTHSHLTGPRYTAQDNSAVPNPVTRHCVLVAGGIQSKRTASPSTGPSIPALGQLFKAIVARADHAFRRRPYSSRPRTGRGRRGQRGANTHQRTRAASAVTTLSIVVGLGFVALAVAVLVSRWSRRQSENDLGTVSHHWMAEQRQGHDSQR